MADKCADCGADAEIYDHGTPLCLLCTDVRDVRTVFPDADVFENVCKARTQYRAALEEIGEMLQLMRDLEPANPDGQAALTRVNDRFAAAKSAYEHAVTELVNRSRTAARRNLSR